MLSREPQELPNGRLVTDSPAASFRFLEMIAGELRRPLDGALAVTELLQRQSLSPDIQAHILTLASQHETLLRLLGDALDLGRAEQGHLELTPQSAELRLLLDDIQEEWQARARQNGVALSVSYHGDDISALIDDARVRQMFNGLVDRALKVTRRGGIEVSLKADRAEGGLRLEGRVRDCGPVLAPDQLARVFDSAADSADSITGGISVLLCRRLADIMHGSIWAEANAGAGAGATIIFEFMAAEAQKETSAEDNQQTNRTAHVLVVDDNATNRMVAEALCEMFDCTSECAEDGVEAVEAAQSGRFDLILMDIKMPRMDGIEATRAIRAMPGRAGTVPIIALTANADPDDAADYIKSGMSCVVEKPIKPEALLNAMNACLSEVGDVRSAAAA